MTDTISAFPLLWPAGWQRTPAPLRKSAKFSKKAYRTSSYTPPGGSPSRYAVKAEVSIADGVERVRAELARMGINDDNVVINSNLELRLDGLPRSNQREPEDPGIAVYWRDHGVTRCMAIDQYDRVADNLAAVAATLDAMRAIERHGGAEILNRAFTGFTALPAPSAPASDPWWIVLGVPQNAHAENVEAAYRRRRAEAHPDRGGTTEAFDRIQRAFDQFKGESDGRR